MNWTYLLEALLLALALTVALGGLALRIGVRRQRNLAMLLVVTVSFSIALTARSLWVMPLSEAETPFRPIAIPKDGFISSDSCQSCHQREYETWHDSYHRKMTQLASPESVLGEFVDENGEGVQLELDGKTFDLGIEDGTHYVELDAPRPGPGGKYERVRRPILVTTGSHHVQLYWYPTGEARNLGLLPYVWLLSEQRWIPRRSIFILPPNVAKATDPEAVAASYDATIQKETEEWPDSKRWNHTCIHCHTTNGQPMFEDLETRVAEFGIACESCHGPSETHVNKNHDPVKRYQQHLTDSGDEDVVDPSKLSRERGSQVCGVCHGITYPKGDRVFDDLSVGRTYRPGDDLEETRRIVQATRGPESLAGLPEADPGVLEQQFWADGMVRVKGREYNGLIETPCYQRGEMTCFSCHTMHQDDADPRERKEWADDQLHSEMRENVACTQCHGEFEQPEVLAAHTQHIPESSGSNCYNCHMSYTTYGLLKAIRSHQIISPSVQESLETGRPNACNQCHLDKTLAWSAEHLEAGWGIEQPEFTDQEQGVPASLLWLLSGDAAQRGLIAWSMGWDAAREASDPRWMSPFLIQLLRDPYDAVRLDIYKSLRKQPGFEDFEYDFIASPEERTEAARRAMKIWQQLPREDVVDIWSLVDDPDRSLPPTIFETLLSQRNDRPVALAE